MAHNPTPLSFTVFKLNAQAVVPPPTTEYTFDNTLSDMAGGSTLSVLGITRNDPCNSATSFGSDGKGPFWTWNTDVFYFNGGCFTVTTNQEAWNAYATRVRKIIDYKNRTSDSGIVFQSGGIRYYPSATSFGDYPNNQVLDLMVVQQSS